MDTVEEKKVGEVPGLGDGSHTEDTQTSSDPQDSTTGMAYIYHQSTLHIVQ